MPLFYENFEGFDVGDGGQDGLSQVDPATGFTWAYGNSSPSHSVTVTDDIAHAGTKCLDFFWPGKALGGMGGAEQRFVCPGEHRGLWLDFWIYLPDGTDGWNEFEHRDNYPQSNNNKFIDLWGRAYTGVNSVLLGWSSNTPHPDVSRNLANIESSWGSDNVECATSTTVGIWQSCGSGPGWNDSGTWPGPLLGRWVRVRAHALLATDEHSSDGVLHLEIDGEDYGTRTALPMSAIAPYNYLKRGYLFGYANTGFDNDTHAFLDDFAIYTSDPGWWS
jgi:hypothetical protein